MLDSSESPGNSSDSADTVTTFFVFFRARLLSCLMLSVIAWPIPFLCPSVIFLSSLKDVEPQ